MSSQRLPGKVLHEIEGKPLLQYLIERIQNATLIDSLIVATSADESDTPIVEFCEKTGVRYHRGALHDVAGRFAEVIDRFRLDAFVRVSGDSPLLDSRLIDTAVEIYISGRFDLVTNLMPRSYPKGQSVEVLSSKSFKAAYEKMHDLEDREHLTRFYYRNCDQFRIFNFECSSNLSNIQLSVDTLDDLALVRRILKKMEKPHWEYGLDEILHIYARIT